MAETEPTFSTDIGASQPVTNSNNPEPSKHTRIHFPLDELGSSRSGHSAGENPHQSPLFGLKSSPIRQGSPLRPSDVKDSANARRRVRSVHAANTIAELPRQNRVPAVSLITPVQRMTAVIPKQVKSPGPNVEDFGHGVFSDEYDLSHEDPRILQDVQRALKLKARREARLKSGQTISSRKDMPFGSDITSGPSPSSGSSPLGLPLTAPASTPITLSKATPGMTSEIDFSPSTGVSNILASSHPVPSSLDDGATLDWTGPGDEDERSERRWTLSIAKLKGKDKAPYFSSVTVEKQESRYAEIIGRIKTVASPHTMRKAFITSDQLGRRYKLVYGSLSSEPERLNVAKVARWYGSQEAIVRTSLEKAEPFTWLKHLEKRGTKTSTRLPWHLSALIVEEYIHSQTRHDPMGTIPEDCMSVGSSPNISISPRAENTPPSRHSPYHTLGPSLSRKRSFEGRISFEPLVESARDSLEVDSHKSGESVYSSGFSGSSSRNPAAFVTASPASSHLELQKNCRRPPNDNDDVSSARNSLSERSSDGGRRVPKILQQPRPSDFELPPEQGSGPEPSFKFVVSSDLSEAGDIPRNNEIPLSVDEPPSDGNLPQSTVDRSHTDPPSVMIHRIPDRHRVRISLPTSDRFVVRTDQKRQQEVDEEKIHQEYELKTQLLDETVAQNYRIRQLLNRIASGVREFEMVQSTVSKSLGVPYNNLPQDLLDAFGHDPAAVTGATRKSRSWKAVDDIHIRLIRQRDTFRDFLSRAAEDTFPTPKSVLDDPIADLLRSLRILETHRREITAKAKAVADVLKKVQTVHAEVKAEYNGTLSHTSVVYPELSHIIALEESYKDQYQQFWEFGMDALTFLLDTVTPFWRTYGKTIGEDVQDFLIIPLYRNEFTGEAKRYPINKFPGRSLSHWLGLLSFFFLSITINLLQGRAALSSSVHCRLLWINNSGIRWTVMPFFWIGIIIQWCAVIMEFCIVLMQLGVLAWWIGWSVKIFS